MHFIILIYSKYYYIFFYFIIYSFLGWCLEVLYSFKNKSKFVNRGFLNGPFCPIYGFGAISLITVLSPLRQHLPFLLIGCFVFPSAIEYFTGFVLEKAFSATWWNYSRYKFNLKGRICLRFSALWWVVSVFLVIFINPNITDKLAQMLPIRCRYVLLISFTSYFIIDFYITLLSLIKLKKLFTQITHISFQLNIKSDSIYKIKNSIKALELRSTAKNFSNKVSDLIENKIYKQEDDSLEKLEIKLSELKGTYDQLLNKIAHSHKRFFTAYPDLKTKFNKKILSEIQEKIRKINNH